MEIAVIDDERPSRKELVHQILPVLSGSQIKEADSRAGAFELISAQSFGLLFADINLNDMEGATLTAAARRILPDAQIVFATVCSQYTIKAFELGVNNYILKPFDPDRVRRVLEECQLDLKHSYPAGEGINGPSGSLPVGRLAVNINRITMLLDIHKIVYIETVGRSCAIHTTDEDYTENQLLREYEKRLASCGFYHICKSYLVNLNHVTEMFPWVNNSLAVKMMGYEKGILPMGREKMKSLGQALGIQDTVEGKPSACAFTASVHPFIGVACTLSTTVHAKSVFFCIYFSAVKT